MKKLAVLIAAGGLLSGALACVSAYAAPGEWDNWGQFGQAGPNSPGYTDDSRQARPTTGDQATYGYPGNPGYAGYPGYSAYPGYPSYPGYYDPRPTRRDRDGDGVPNRADRFPDDPRRY